MALCWSGSGSLRSRLGIGLVLITLAGGLAACRRPLAQSPHPQRLPVVTTVVPVTLFTRAVAGECADVTALIPPQSGAHDVQSSPADLAVLRRARVLVKNGLGLDAVLDPVIAAAGHGGLQFIDSSRGVATLPSGGAHGHGSVNPHIWLDPRRALQQVQNIRDGLVQADPGCAEGYKRRAEQFSQALRRLDRQLEQRLRPYRGRTIVAFHDVAPYFAQRYGLKQAFLVADPELEPTPQDLLRVSRLVKQTGLRALLSEPLQGNQSLKGLAGDLHLGIAVFNPLETATPQQEQDPATYITVMQTNAAAVAKSLGD